MEKPNRKRIVSRANRAKGFVFIYAVFSTFVLATMAFGWDFSILTATYYLLTLAFGAFIFYYVSSVIDQAVSHLDD